MLVSSLRHERTFKTVLFYKETVLRENHTNREIKSGISQLSYIDVMNSMKLLTFVTKLSMYHGCFNRKTFWEEKFTPANMKNCGCHNVRKDREIKNGEQYVVLDISLKFGNLDKIKITGSEPKDY